MTCMGQNYFISMNILHIVLLLILCRISAGQTDYNDFRVEGPGLNPDTIVMPARYFFVHSNVSKKDLLEVVDKLEVDVSGRGSNGACRVWVNKLNQQDGTMIVRYKLYETCYDFTISVQVKGKHISASPYYFTGPIHSDLCYCPAQVLDEWLQQYGCTGDYSHIHEDLSPFYQVSMRDVIPKIVKQYHQPESTSFCHYVLKNNEVYRKCYGKHVGFNMFSDNILLVLARKVVLPDMELVVNLGDWPLVRQGDESLPIFSWCGSEDTKDIVMPTYDITESTIENMGRVTLDILSVQGNAKRQWSEREPKAFWRGRDSRQERLQLINIARQNPDLINASLTNFFFFRNKEEQYGPKQPHVSFFKFFDYKYQINVDGTVAAYRLPYLLAGGGLVLKQESPYYEHFYRSLQEWKHYVPVKRDLSDMVAQIQWAQQHDQEAHNIAINGQNFANEHLLPQHIICYHAVLFSEWSKRQRDKVVLAEDMTHVPQVNHNCDCHTRHKDEL